MDYAPHLPRTAPRERPPLLRILLRIALILLALAILGFIAFCTYYGVRASKFDLNQVSIMPERTVILDRNGKSLGKIHGENRDIVTIDNMSPNFLMSIIAREDVRFYDHSGVDFKGLLRATVRNIKDRGMTCLLYTSPSPRDGATSRMPSSA